ncbi:MAG: ATP synthase subunit I [Polyangiales bacterium]
MIDNLKTTTPRSVAVAAMLLTALAFALGGTEVGLGAAVGGLVAVVDAWAIIWLVSQVLTGAGLSRAIAVALLASKLIILLAVCWALLARLAINPIGFSVGLSALVVGMLYAGAMLSAAEIETSGEA